MLEILELENYDKYTEDWFLSSEGEETFNALDSIKSRCFFIYSYLGRIADNALEDDSFLFRIAFLLADAVYSAKTSYSSFPEILDPEINPFVAYVQNAKTVHSKKADYCILLSILHGTVDPFDTSEWIYDDEYFHGKNTYVVGKGVLDKNKYLIKLKENNKCFVEYKHFHVADIGAYDIVEIKKGFESNDVVDLSVYDIDEKLRFIQIELAWLFILQDKEGK